MTSKTECLETLRSLIERAERDELTAAQAVIIAFALTSPDLPGRAAAVTDLQTTLAAEMRTAALDPMQAAYYAAIDAMIDRTRDAVTATSATIEPSAQ